MTEECQALLRPESWNGGPMTPLNPIVVHETKSPDKPVLYDARGRPLVKKTPRVGFRPPRKESG